MTFPNMRAARVFAAATEGSGSSSQASNDIKTAVIPVGGLGTRMLPMTMSTPKNLLPVGNKSLIEYAVEEAIGAGCENIVIVCSPQDAEAYKQEFALLKDGLGEKVAKKYDLQAAVARRLELGEKITFVVQDKPIGLGDAIYCAHDYIQGKAFAVILPDDLILEGLSTPALKSMTDVYNGGISVAAMRVKPEATKSYGVFRLAENAEPDSTNMAAIGMVEKPQQNPPSYFAAIGRYILPTSIMDILSRGTRGAGDEVQLTDAIDEMVQTGQETLYATRFRGTRYDCGNMKGYMEAQQHAAPFALDMINNPQREIAPQQQLDGPVTER